MWLAADEIGTPLLMVGVVAAAGVLGLIGYFIWIGVQAAGSKSGDREAGDATLRHAAGLLGGEFRRPPPVRKHRASKEFGAVSGVRDSVSYQLSMHRWSAPEIGGSAQIVVWPQPGQQFVLEVFGWKGPRRLPPNLTLEDIFGPDVAHTIPHEFREPLRELVVDSRAVGASREQLHVYSPPAVFEWPLKGEPAELAAWVERVLDRSRQLLCPVD
jgi:hypothetical protein